MNLCKSHNEYVGDLYWVAKLSNQECIYYDNRTELEPCWLRLQKYIEDKSLSIDEIELCFRSHREKIPVSQIGYYHTKAASGIISVSGGGSFGTTTEEIWKFGCLLDDKTVKIQWWRVPELIIINEDFKTVEECKKLIIRNNI